MGYDYQNTGYNPLEKQINKDNVHHLKQKWNLKLDNAVKYSASVIGEKIYFTTTNGYLYSANSLTGKVIWKKQIYLNKIGIQYVENDRIYISACESSNSKCVIFSFFANTGLQVWNKTIECKIGDLVGISETNIFFSNQNKITAIDKKTGLIIWNINNGSRVAVLNSEDLVVSSESDRVQIIEEKTGNLKWFYSGLGKQLSTPSISIKEKQIYIHSSDGFLYALDANGCNEIECSFLWKGQTGRQSKEYVPSVAVDDKFVYVGVGRMMFSFNANGCNNNNKNGICKSNWESKTNCDFMSTYPPSVVNGIVFKACGNKYLYAFDSINGDILWEYKTLFVVSPLRSSPAISNGFIYHLVTFDYALFAFTVV